MKIVLVLGLLMVFQGDNYLHLTNEGELIEKVNQNEFTASFLTPPMMDLKKYHQFVTDLDRKIYQKPTNAFIDEQNKIIKEEVGSRLNKRQFSEDFYFHFYKRGSADIEIPKQTIYPRVDSELLGNIRTQRIGHYLTYFRTSNKERSQNITIAVNAINNHVVFPGETFSFNKVVGKRTKAKGYLRAPVIVRGELTDGIGGGICQVSSTLFNAVDRAGLTIVQRYSHSKRVPYVPPGRDATVSWYGPDFTFKNNYNQPLLIRAKVVDGKVIVMLFSSDVIHFVPKKVPSISDVISEDI